MSKPATRLLKHPIDLNDTREHSKLVERIAQVERDERCVQRVALLTAGLTALAVVGLGYGLILEEGFAVASSFVARLIAEIALASLITLVGVTSLWLIYRSKLNRLMRDCHRLATQFLQCRQDPSFGDGVTDNRATKETGVAILGTISH